MTRPSWSLYARPSGQLARFCRSFSQVHRTKQKLVMLWSLSIAVGSHKLCAHTGCVETLASKRHLESVHLPDGWAHARDGTGVDTILCSTTSVVEIEAAADVILNLIGSRSSGLLTLPAPPIRPTGRRRIMQLTFES